MTSDKLKLYDVSDIVCKYYNVKESEIFIKTRKREILWKRQLFHYLARKYTIYSYESIGNYNDNCKLDHSTIMHSCKTISNLIDVDKYLHKEVMQLEMIIKEYIRELEYFNTNSSIIKKMMLLCDHLNYNKEYKNEIYSDLDCILTQEKNNIAINYKYVK